MFYRAPPRYTRSGPYPYHQAMLLHYGQPLRRNVQLPANEVAAFAAGDSVGTGSYLQSTYNKTAIRTLNCIFVLLRKNIYLYRWSGSK